MCLRGILRSFALATVLAFACLPAKAADESLFGSSEVRSNNISSFTNWTGVLNRYHAMAELGEGLCATAAGGVSYRHESCAWDKWEHILDEYKGESQMEQLRGVNDTFNSVRYVEDSNNWGRQDYWETVFEFLDRNAGDCEDYAISKYVTLRKLGWPADRLRIVIVRDTKLDLNHAILAAYTDDGVYIGDNQVRGLVKASSIHHYRPIYSINENGWWLHRARKSD